MLSLMVHSLTILAALLSVSLSHAAHYNGQIRPPRVCMRPREVLPVVVPASSAPNNALFIQVREKKWQESMYGRSCCMIILILDAS